MFVFLKTKSEFWYAFAFTACLSVGMHFKIFSLDLMGRHLWRQSKTYINTQQFYRNDWNILNPRTNNWGGETYIDRMEFPVMQWTMAVAHSIFGENILVARIYMFALGLLGFIGFYLLILAWTNDRSVAILSAFAFYVAPVFYYYTMNPLPDVFALVAAVFSLAFYYRYLKNDNQNQLLFSAICLSLAVLAKLPYILISAIFLYDWVASIASKQWKWTKKLTTYFGLALIPPVLWYGWVVMGWDTTTIVGGIINTPATAERLLYILKYHLLVMWPEILIGYPSLILLFIGAFFIFRNKILKSRPARHMAIYGFFIVAYFAYEISLIDTGHDYYMMPFQIFFFALVGLGIHKLNQGSRIKQWLLLGLILAMPIHAALRVNRFWSMEFTYFDRYIVANKAEMQALIPPGERCIYINDVSNCIYSYMIDREGYTFNHDYLPDPWVEDMIVNKKIYYMWSNSKPINDSIFTKPYFDSLIHQHEGVLLVKLKAH